MLVTILAASDASASGSTGLIGAEQERRTLPRRQARSEGWDDTLSKSPCAPRRLSGHLTSPALLNEAWKSYKDGPLGRDCKVRVWPARRTGRREGTGMKSHNA